MHLTCYRAHAIRYLGSHILDTRTHTLLLPCLNAFDSMEGKAIGCFSISFVPFPIGCTSSLIPSPHRYMEQTLFGSLFTFI